MNILIYDSGSYLQNDLFYHLQRTGHHLKKLTYKFTDYYHDVLFEEHFYRYLHDKKWDCVMSTGFYPAIANICHQNKIKYISWIYDSPIKNSDMTYFTFNTNYIYIFDRTDANSLSQKGAEHVYHLPLAVNTKRLNQITISPSDQTAYTADISFVGQFYNNTLQHLLKHQDPYDVGYIDSIVQAQLQIYGYNFIDNMISDELLRRLNSKLISSSNFSNILTRDALYQNIAHEITHIERSVLCNILGQMYDMHYYSDQKEPSLSHLTYKGIVHDYLEMPKIFKLSKLNLYPICKTVQSGIPITLLNILGCQGALLCNYQPEIVEYFSNEENIIMYNSIEDAIEKATYYLKHDEERTRIAHNGYQKVSEFFSYSDRLSFIFKTAGLE